MPCVVTEKVFDRGHLFEIEYTLIRNTTFVLVIQRIRDSFD